MWGGRLWFTTAMLFAIGLIVEFTIGGLSGVTHAISPSDTQQTDTYYIVAHFHYVLFGGAVFGIFAGFYYWWPKIFGRMLSEKLGKWNFWLMVIGMNLTFGPMHIVGLEGQSRRNYRVIPGMGVRLLEPGRDHRRVHPRHGHPDLPDQRRADQPRSPATPRSTRGTPGRCEWMTTNPPKAHNFDAIPSVHSIDEFFHRKYEEDEESGELHARSPRAEEIMADQEAHADAHIHMPSPSYWPMVIALRPAGRGHRPHLQPRHLGASARSSSCSACTAGCRSRRWPTRSTTTTRRPDSTKELATVELTSRPTPRSAPRRPTTNGHAGHGDGRPRHDHRPVQQQARHVALPRLGVPALRRPDLHLHALSRPHAGRAQARTRSTTSRSPRSARSSC